MKKLLIKISFILFLLTAIFSPMVAIASDISTAIFYGVITITNNGTAVDNVTAVFDLDSQSLIDLYGVDTAFNYVAIRNAGGADAAFMPSVNSIYPWCIFVPSLGNYASTTYILYTGNSSMNATKYWFPGPAGANVTDNTSLNIGNDGTYYYHEIYIDASQTGNITTYWDPVYGGYILSYSDGIITSNITSSNTTEQTAADGAIPVSLGNYMRSGALLTNLPACTITSVSFYLQKVLAPTGTANITIRKASDDTILGIIGTIDVSTIGAAYAWYTWNGTISNPSLQDIRITFDFWGGNATNYVNVAKKGSDVLSYSQLTVYSAGSWTDAPAQDNTYKLTFYIMSSVKIYNVASGEYNIATVISGGVHTLEVGTSSNNTAFSGNVSNSISDYNFCPSPLVTYIASLSIYKVGAATGNWTWSYSTTFPDNSGNGNTMTPSFRTAPSDSDVIATLTSFAPLETALAPPFSIETAPPFYTENITISGNFTTSNVSTPVGPGAGGPPGAGLIEDVTTASDTPLPWMWGILAMVTIAMASFGADYMQKRYGFRSIWPKVAIGIIVIGLLVTWGKFDWWMLIMYGFIALSLAIASRHTDVGGAVSQHGLIGFLAQSWIGLTIINHMLEGAFITANEQVWANYYAFTQDFQLFNVFSVPVLNLDFFTHGIPALIRWDYSFFGGNAQLIQYMLYSITAVTAFIIFLAIIPLVYNFFKSIF